MMTSFTGNYQGGTDCRFTIARSVAACTLRALMHYHPWPAASQWYSVWERDISSLRRETSRSEIYVPDPERETWKLCPKCNRSEYTTSRFNPVRILRSAWQPVQTVSQPPQVENIELVHPDQETFNSSITVIKKERKNNIDCDSLS